MSVWSPFTRNVTKVVPFPGSETETATIRKLSHHALEEALKERQLQGLDYLRRIGPGGLIKELQDQGGEDALKEKVSKDPYLQYDRGVLLKRGITSWTVGDSVADADLLDLDDETADAFGRAIYDLSKPKSEEERKNA